MTIPRLTIGQWQIDLVSGGTLRLDGGAMFGIVPKPLWNKVSPADEQNRIRMNTNCVLARNGTHTVLIDSGYGGKFDERHRGFQALEPGEPLRTSLAALGVTVEEVDAVILSHLHFDHAGGTTRRDAQGQILPTFPRARHFIQRREWSDATSSDPALAESYDTENFLALEQAGLVHWLEGDESPLAGVNVQVTGGHTPGHQLVRLRSNDQELIYLGDLCPTRAHLKARWTMAYDLAPLETRRVKSRVLGDAADRGAWIVWSHDPDLAAARLARDPKREFVVAESIAR